MLKVLIVDDHPIVRLLLRTHLANLLGIGTILEAENGRAAIDITRQERPDLIILDLDLPAMGGLEAIPRLKLQHPAARILVLSGHDASVYAPRAMRMGARGFVSKTEDIGEVMRSVEMVIAGYRVFPADSMQSRSSYLDGNDDADRLSQLSNKEMSVLELLVKGQSNKNIAELLHISNKTVSSHKISLMRKLGVTGVVELVEFARRMHVIP
jgi:two-component system response regulator EvgA